VHALTTALCNQCSLLAEHTVGVLLQVDAREVAEEEWECDANGGSCMGPDDFKDAIFECAHAQHSRRHPWRPA
jgi:hypothetical protein